MNRIRLAGRAAVPALAVVALVAGSLPASASTDRLVKGSAQDERTPAAGGGYLAWARTLPGHPRHYDVFAQRFGERPTKVNGPGSVAFAGGIDGSTLVYQQLSGGRSTIRFYDLVTGANRPAPHLVNSAAFESGPSLSGRWLLFTRQFSAPQVWKILLYDRDTGRMRTLARVSGRWARYAQSGQVAGDWAAWQACTPYCKVFVYRISTRQTWLVPNPERRFQYAPSVLQDGTVYFAESHAACGHVTIERYSAGGSPVTAASLRANTDLSFTSARVRAGGRTEILYDATSCADYSGDIRALTL